MEFLGNLGPFVLAVVAVIINGVPQLLYAQARGFALKPAGFAYLVGAFVACLTGGTFASFSFLAWLNVPFFVGPVNGIVVSLILYVILAKAMKK